MRPKYAMKNTIIIEKTAIDLIFSCEHIPYLMFEKK